MRFAFAEGEAITDSFRKSGDEMNHSSAQRYLMLLLSLSAVPSRAFEFEEHAGAAHAALEVGATGEDWKSAANEARAWLGAASQKDLGRAVFCADGSHGSAGCLHLADITGIAGDLVSDPGTLLLFLKNRGDDAPIEALGEGALVFGRMKLGFDDRECSQVPTGITQDPGRIKALSSIVHSKPKKDKNPRKRCDVFYEMENLQIQLLDADLAQLAARNCSHFEIRGSTEAIPKRYDAAAIGAAFTHSGMADPWPTESRGTREDWPTAVKEGIGPYYLELHGLALMFAEVAASKAKDDPQALRFRSFALTAELFALHYLQDLYAPGHRLTTEDAGRHGKKRRELHNEENSLGEPPRIRDRAKLCAVTKDVASFKELDAAACGANVTVPLPKLHGDGGLRCTDDAPERLQRQMLAALSLISLREVTTMTASGDPSRKKAIEALTSQWNQDLKTVLPSFHQLYEKDDERLQLFLKAAEVWQTGKLDVGDDHPKLRYLGSLPMDSVFQALPTPL